MRHKQTLAVLMNYNCSPQYLTLANVNRGPPPRLENGNKYSMNY